MLCARCGHEDDDHVGTQRGGLGRCLQDAWCDAYVEEIDPLITVYGCGICGARLHDYALHAAWHAGSSASVSYVASTANYDTTDLSYDTSASYDALSSGG
jgi:hypothetical protein